MLLRFCSDTIQSLIGLHSTERMTTEISQTGEPEAGEAGATGVRYLCQRCGNCCKWPGDIWITEEEIPKIARFVGFSPLEFIERFTRLTNNRRGLSIIDKPNGECVFLEGNECTIQPVKPHQCSGFPNDWNFPGWQDICEAIPMSSDHQPLGIPREAKAKRASSPSEKGNAS